MDSGNSEVMRLARANHVRVEPQLLGDRESFQGSGQEILTSLFELGTWMYAVSFYLSPQKKRKPTVKTRSAGRFC